MFYYFLINLNKKEIFFMKSYKIFNYSYIFV